jgi:hypothetical protein
MLVPSPSCPKPPRPQQFTTPAEVSAHECSPPTEISTTSARPCTWTAERRFSVVPSADLPDASQGRTCRAGLRTHALHDCTHRSPSHAYQTRQRRLVRAHRQPRDGVLERRSEAAAVARPRNLRDHDAVLGALHARRLCLDECTHHPNVVRSPSARSRAGVVPRTTCCTVRAPLPMLAPRPHANHQPDSILLAHILDHAALDTQRASQHLCAAHLAPFLVGP